MKTKKVFFLAWGIFFAFVTIITILVVGSINLLVNDLYSSTKNEILLKANSLVDSSIRLSEEALLLEKDLIWSGESDEKIGEQAKALLKAEHPFFYHLLFKSGINWLLFLILPIIFAWLLWENKIEVSPEWELIAEWTGKKMEPFKNGYYYPFKYFGFFREIAEIPMNKQSICILSGVRDGLSPEIIKEYPYGTASNVEPETGDSLRLLYRVEFICRNSSILFYSMNDAYEYLAVSIEKEVASYVHSKSSEEVIDDFNRQDLSSICFNIKDYILDKIGLEILQFIPVDSICSPEVEDNRRVLDMKRRELKIIEADSKNAAKREAGRRKILKAALTNMAEEKKIADEHNAILKNRIDTIQNTANVKGYEALKFINKQKTLDTIAESAINGNIVYIDENSHGSASQGAALGFGINATTKKNNQ